MRCDLKLAEIVGGLVVTFCVRSRLQLVAQLLLHRAATHELEDATCCCARLVCHAWRRCFTDVVSSLRVASCAQRGTPAAISGTLFPNASTLAVSLSGSNECGFWSAASTLGSGGGSNSSDGAAGFGDGLLHRVLAAHTGVAELHVLDKAVPHAPITREQCLAFGRALDRLPRLSSLHLSSRFAQTLLLFAEPLPGVHSLEIFSGGLGSGGAAGGAAWSQLAVAQALGGDGDASTPWPTSHALAHIARRLPGLRHLSIVGSSIQLEAVEQLSRLSALTSLQLRCAAYCTNGFDGSSLAFLATRLGRLAIVRCEPSMLVRLGLQR